jgi:O-antigen/teichoic acid export membrane protein
MRMARLVSGAFWLTAGTGVARIMPIFLGMCFARQYSPITYASYVAFVIAANLVVAIPLMGTTQLMLSEVAPAPVSPLLRQYLPVNLLAHALCWLTTALLSLLLPSRTDTSFMDLHTLLVLYLFSLGYCFTGIAAAAFSKASQRARAGACWIISTATSTLAGLAGMGMHISVDWVLALMAAGWLLGGLLCLHGGTRTLPHVGSHSSADDPPPLSRPRLAQIFSFGAPSVVYLMGFYLMTQQARQSSDADLQGAFSLGYQLFSAALFLPGVLGNIVTPRLARLKQSLHARKQLISQILVLYAGIAFAWLAAVFVTMPWLLAAFHLPDRPDVRQLVLVLQGCAGIAAVMALLNQLLAADRLSKHMLLASLLWLVLSHWSAFTSDDAAFKSAQGMMGAYTACLLYSFTAWYRTQRSIQRYENG